MTDNEITYQIRGAIFDVYNELGPEDQGTLILRSDRIYQ